MDLAIKPKHGMDVPSTSGPEGPYYPCLSLRDEQVSEFFEEVGDVKKDDVVTCMVKLKVTGLRDEKYGKCIEFDVTELEPYVHGDGHEHKPGYGGFSKALMKAMQED